jgi:imidazolonepropionase-like amidohydrolase
MPSKKTLVPTFFLLLLLALLAAAPMPGDKLPGDKLPGDKLPADDLAGARAVFERNLQAIRDRDRDAYLANYLPSPGLVRTGPGGVQLGYQDLAATAGEGWPDHLEADDLRLTPVAPGVVYGTYRYRVRYGGEEVAGLSERLFLETPAGWKIAVTTAFAAPPGTPPPPRALVGATLADGTGADPVPDSAVVIRDGRIECAGPRAACPVPAGVAVTDLSGRWIAPGLIDAHVHFSQTGWADGRPDALDVRERHPYPEVAAELRRHPERAGRSLLCSGVTAAFDVGGFPWTFELPAWAEPRTDVPRLAAAGPLLSTLDPWLNLPAARQFIYLKDADAAREGVRYLHAAGADAVKVWYIRTGEPGRAEAVRAAGEAAGRHGLPLIVHATGLDEAKEALRAGARLLVHSVWDRPVDEEFLRLAREAGAIYTPTLTVGRGYQRMFESALSDRPLSIDDPNGCVSPEVRSKLAETPGLDPGATADELAAREARLAERERIAAENLKRVAAAGIPVALGTDAGNPLTLHGPSVHAELEAMQAAGLTPMQVLVAATRDAAAALGRQEDLGTLEKGKHADLLVLAADPTKDAASFRQLVSVMRGGELRTVEELSALATAEGDE